MESHSLKFAFSRNKNCRNYPAVPLYNGAGIGPPSRFEFVDLVLYTMSIKKQPHNKYDSMLYFFIHPPNGGTMAHRFHITYITQMVVIKECVALHQNRELRHPPLAECIWPRLRQIPRARVPCHPYPCPCRPWRVFSCPCESIRRRST